MEKLVTLLNEYQHSTFNEKSFIIEFEGYQNRTFFEKDFPGKVGEEKSTVDETFVISKRFGFIKRLVDNDKIDRIKTRDKVKDLGEDYGWFGVYSGIEIDCLLMLLSIQNEPIQFLCEILK